MSLRVQKKWSRLGNPSAPGDHPAPGIGLIVSVTEEHLRRVRELGGNPVAVLENRESSGAVAEWVIVELRAA